MVWWQESYLTKNYNFIVLQMYLKNEHELYWIKKLVYVLNKHNFCTLHNDGFYYCQLYFQRRKLKITKKERLKFS